MVGRMGNRSIAGRSWLGRSTALLALLAAFAGCGSSLKGSARASGADGPASCAETVLDTLGRVVARVYHQGLSSERTAVARRLIARSAALREAVQRGDAVAAQAAAQSLLAGGKLTNLKVLRGNRTLADVGGGPALAPLQGSITGPGGARIGRYFTSVWSQAGFTAESDGIGQGLIALRAHGRSVGGSLALPAGPLPDAGRLTVNHVHYQYTSFPAVSYPAGALRVYLLKPVASTTALCGRKSEDTLVNTLAREAELIYAGEAGRRTLAQVRRVQGDQALLAAVARRDPAASRRAVQALLNQHIVRLRVVAPGGPILADLGGPYVLAPVRATLALDGHTIGSFVLSIQDDEGYLRLTRRLLGLRVLMYMNAPHPTLVKNSLGPAPGAVPPAGAYSYRGRRFRVVSVHARAFPSGPLTIRVLIPIPYS
jgi:hypothetical protein